MAAFRHPDILRSVGLIKPRAAFVGAASAQLFFG